MAYVSFFRFFAALSCPRAGVAVGATVGGGVGDGESVGGGGG